MKKAIKTNEPQAVMLGAAVGSIKAKLPSSKARYQTYAMDGPMPFEMYCAGEGQPGGGYLVFEEWGVRVVLKPESAWRAATKAKRKASNKLANSDGSWNVWFLLSRALVLSKTALAESERGMGFASSVNEAAHQLASMGKAIALASDARAHALTMLFDNDKNLLKVARTERAFIDWFGAKLADKLAEGDFAFVDSITGFVRAAHGLPDSGFPSDVLKFRKVLAEQALLAGGPPTKSSVRLALGDEDAKGQSKAEGLGLDPFHESGKAGKRPKSPGHEDVSIWANRTDSQSDQTTKTFGKWVSRASSPPLPNQPLSMKSAITTRGKDDTFDESVFKRLLERTGFSWLPKGRMSA